jgi:hypothetical protein
VEADTAPAEVNDGSCVANLQVLVDANVAAERQLTLTGTSVLVQPPEGKNQKVELLVENILHVGTVNAAKYPIAKAKVALCVAKEKVVSAVVQLHSGAVEAFDYAQVAVGFTPRPEIERWYEIPASFVETEKEDLVKRPEAIREKIVLGRAELVRKGAEEADSFGQDCVDLNGKAEKLVKEPELIEEVVDDALAVEEPKAPAAPVSDEAAVEAEELPTAMELEVYALEAESIPEV